MKNQALLSVPGTQRFAKCPSTVKAGDPVIIGKDPGVAVNDYQTSYGGTTFEMTGAYVLTVIAATVISPLSGLAIGAGDKIYASGTLDSTTNVTTGLTLSAATGGTPFGTLDPQYPGAPITSGTTDTDAWVRIGQGVQ